MCEIRRGVHQNVDLKLREPAGPRDSGTEASADAMITIGLHGPKKDDTAQIEKHAT